MSVVEIRHGHLFCGLGGGAKGFNRARPVWVRPLQIAISVRGAA